MLENVMIFIKFLQRGKQLICTYKALNIIFL